MVCSMYNKSTCLQVLYQTQNCGVSCNDSSIAIEGDVDQEPNENTAQLIKNGLTVLGASQACVSHLLYLFPLCGANVTVSREQCLLLSTDVCTNEWQVALSIFKDQFTNCESLPNTEQGLLFICILSFTSLPLFRSDPFINSSITMTSDSVMVNCSDQFILINGTCRPLCDKLKLFTSEDSYIDYIILIMSSISGLLCG